MWWLAFLQIPPLIALNHISINPLWSLIGRLTRFGRTSRDPIFDQVDSHIPVPTTPGLGIEVIEAEARRFLGRGTEFPDSSCRMIH